MTIEGLAEQENLLYSKVMELYNQPLIAEADEKLGQIFADYRKVHQAYADLSGLDIEALKRGLFLQWYAMTEASFLNGIGDIDQQAGEQIMKVTKKWVDTKSVDTELTWMLKYYLNWSFAFEIYPTFKLLAPGLLNTDEDSLPNTIDREAMKQRGQMGIYWSSLSRFSDSN